LLWVWAALPAAAQLGPRFVTGEIVGISGANSATSPTLPGKGVPGISSTAALLPARPTGAVVSADDLVSAPIQIPYANEFRQTIMQTETVFPGQPNLLAVRTTFTGGNGKGTLCLACGPVGRAGGPIVGLNQLASGAPIPGGTTAPTMVTFTYGTGSTAMFARPPMNARATSVNSVSVTPNKALGFGGSVRVANFFKQEVDLVLSGQPHAAATPAAATGLDFGNGPGMRPFEKAIGSTQTIVSYSAVQNTATPSQFAVNWQSNLNLGWTTGVVRVKNLVGPVASSFVRSGYDVISGSGARDVQLVSPSVLFRESTATGVEDTTELWSWRMTFAPEPGAVPALAAGLGSLTLLYRAGGRRSPRRN
jgi:hypothetical protein